MSADRFQNFGDFYRFYLTEHAHPVSRRLHFAGTTLALLMLATGLVTHRWWLAALALIPGYALAWIGHFCFERNRPATFQYPALSLLGDLRLWIDILRGRQSL